MTRQLNKRFRLTGSSDSGVLLDLKKGEYWQLNTLAMTVITRLADGHELDRIVTDLQKQHPAEASAVGRDVRRIASEFRDIGSIAHD